MKLDIDVSDRDFSDEKATKVTMEELKEAPINAKITGYAESEFGPMLFLEGNRFVPIPAGGASMKNLVRAFGNETDDWNGKTVTVKHHVYLIGKNKREQPGRLVVPAKEQEAPAKRVELSEDDKIPFARELD